MKNNLNKVSDWLMDFLYSTSLVGEDTYESIKSRTIASLELSSLQLLDLVSGLEDRFGIELTDEEYHNIMSMTDQTVEELTDTIYRKIFNKHVF